MAQSGSLIGSSLPAAVSAWRLDELRGALRETAVATAGLATGWPDLDELLPGGGLPRGGVHEWVGVASPDGEKSDERSSFWGPPLAIMSHLVRRALAAAGGLVSYPVWIGASVWPYPRVLVGAADRQRAGSLERSLFVRASDRTSRLWAADVALRNPAVAVVVADGSGFDLAATRRLQLAAEAGGTVCLLARPPRERSALSAATTRWWVRSHPSLVPAKRWTVELLRCKGMRPVPGACDPRIVEHDHATGTIALVPGLLDGPGQAEIEMAGRARRTG
jgi:protein ImuA